jgi:uncharacterized protein YodC (DUF2158 family)
MAFEPGDVVALKSGGYSMTVVSIADEDIDCLWVGDDGVLFRQRIPAVALTIVDLADIDESEEDEHHAEDEEHEDADDEEDDDDEEDEDEEDDESDKKRRRKKR